MEERRFKVEELFHHPLIFLLAIVSTILQFFIFVPSFVFKKCVITYVKYSQNLSLGEPLDCMDSLFAYAGYSRGTVLTAVLKVKGNNMAETIEEIIERKVFQMKLKNLQKLRYSKLKQYPYSFMGYWFWKKDEAFNIKNHIKKIWIENEISISTAHQQAYKAPFVENRSPWDIIVFENKSEFSTIVIRIHHLLGDAKSLVKFVVEGLGQKKLHSVEAKKGLENLPRTQLPLLPFYLMKYNFHLLLLQNLFQKHPWRINPSEKLPDVIQFSQEFSMSSINCARGNFNNCRTSAILLAAMSQACVKFIRANCPKLSNSNNLPIWYILPKANHPEFFTGGHAFYGPIFAPEESGLQHSNQVGECQNRFTYLREKSFDPICGHVCSQMAASFIQPIRVKLPEFCSYIFAITNIAGEKEQIQIGESPCVDFSFSAVVTGTSLGVVIAVFSYMDKIRFTVITKETVMDEKRCQDLVGLLEQEMFALLR